MLHPWFARRNQFVRDGNGLKVHVDRVLRGIGKKIYSVYYNFIIKWLQFII